MDMISGLKLSFMSDRKSHVCTEEEVQNNKLLQQKRSFFFFSLFCCCSPVPRKALGNSRWLWASSGSPVHTLCCPIPGACLQQVDSWAPGRKGQKRTSPGPRLSGALLRSLPKGLVQQLALTSSWTEHSHMVT